MKKYITFVLAALLLVGCASLYTQVVTITEVRNSAMKELATLYAQGKITETTDAKITQADAVYRQAAEVAQKALIAYRDNPSTATNYTSALQATKVAVSGVLDILSQFISTTKNEEYRLQISKANKL